MNEPSETFGKKLKRWREGAGILPVELARRVGVSPTYIGNLEKDFSPSAQGGTPQPSVEVCDKIARALSLPLAMVRLAAGYAPPASGGYDQRLEEDLLSYFREFDPAKRAEVLAIVRALFSQYRVSVREITTQDHLSQDS